MIPKEWIRLYNKLRASLYTFCRQHPILYTCALCDNRSAQRLCQPCTEQFFHAPHHSCSACALPLPHSALLCGECLRHMPAFDDAYSPFVYEKPLSDLIFQFKDKGNSYAGRALADIFCRRVQHHLLQQHKPLPDLITAVPLHWKKQLQRGTNQSAFLAHHISQQLNITLFTQVGRSHPSIEQKQLDRKQRLSNMRDSFTVPATLTNQHVAIVDDVMTTGATVSALAIALKKAGAGKISVWVLARVPKYK